MRFVINESFEDYAGKLLTFQAKIHSPNNYSIIQIYDGIQYIETVTPKNDHFQFAEVSTTITSGNVYILSINIHKEIDTYVDDVKLIIQ